MGLNKKALGLMEVVVALLIAVGAAIPILKMVTKSRNETTSSINYLRAMELADEALEWASVAKFSDLGSGSPSGKNLENNSGPIIDANLTPMKIDATQSGNDNWKDTNVFKDNLEYSSQYSNAFFYRDIKVTKLDNFGGDILKKVTVTVKWSEGHRPSNINVDSDEREKKIELSLLVINDENLSF